MYHSDNNSRSSTQRSQLSHFTIIQDSPFGQKQDSTFTGTCLAASLAQAKLRHIRWWVWLSWASRHVPCVGPPPELPTCQPAEPTTGEITEALQDVTHRERQLLLGCMALRAPAAQSGHCSDMVFPFGAARC